ncbi:MAG TPA: hypothetical protein P5026_12310 [Kiritimatiellia bacterium]|nr:hypothetical protein [Kiritimatiellia bacterium]HRU71167.1 hypothetical protein [Kiritimatiellia bacterium]
MDAAWRMLGLPAALLMSAVPRENCLNMCGIVGVGGDHPCLKHNETPGNLPCEGTLFCTGLCDLDFSNCTFQTRHANPSHVVWLGDMMADALADRCACLVMISGAGP